MTFPRPLTDSERDLMRWMLEHGQAGAESYITQLDQATVISQCDCGCASFDLKIGDHPTDYAPGMKIISDYYIWDGHDTVGGVFVFLRDNMLGGLEAHSWLDPCPPLPTPDMLITMDEANRRNAEPSHSANPRSDLKT